MFKLLEKLVKIPTYNEDNCKIAINECLKIFNNNIKIQSYKNSVLLSNINTNNFDIISTCHIDVVPMSIYNINKKDNIIYGRGVFDMKSFLVSALFNLKYIIDNNINIKYGIIIATDEETAIESETKYWANNIKTKIVLDSDSGVGDINKIVKNILGALTIKTKCSYNKNEVKNIFGKYYIDFVDDEIDILIDNDNKLEELKKYIKDFNILMFNKCINYDIDNKYNLIYKNICENILNNKIEYITTKNTTDSRFFDNCIVINHQATGGDYHKDTEWLDYDSFMKFNKIQLDFLTNILI